MPINRKPTRAVQAGNLMIGGEYPVTVQSMLNIPAQDVQGNVRQAVELADAGCDIIRVAVPDIKAVQLVTAIKNAITIPLVADIHFDYRIALACAEAGVDKIRINPGNIGDDDRVKQVADLCRKKRIPIRIGVNGGSLDKNILHKYGRATPEALAESALYHASLLNRFDFDDIVISLKSSNVQTMVQAYELLSQQVNYPLHLGVTEAGTREMGVIKSSIGIGSLLLRGIGDTIRVSLTADPVEEVKAGRRILQALGHDTAGVRLISCPTCGRTKIDLIGLAGKVEEALAGCKKNLTVAVMGCAVNGPGEAKEADIGIAGGDGYGLLFKKGEIIKKLPEEELLCALLDEIEQM